jgi:hypothetical protein
MWSWVSPTAAWHAAQNFIRAEPLPLVTPKMDPSGMIIV